MAQKYLLACQSCAKDIEVEPKNAGNQMRCRFCTKTTQAPSMREIRQLPLVEFDEVSPRSAEKRQINMGGRWLFILGILLALGGGSAAFMLHLSQKSLDTQLPEYRLTSFEEKQMAEYKAVDVVQAWDFLKNTIANKEWVEHPAHENRRIAASRRFSAWIALGIASLGILAAISSLFLTKK